MERRKSWWPAVAAVMAAAAFAEFAMGRSALCPCGRVALWHGAVRSPENSQQLTDWYSFSHVIHGMLLYGAAWFALRRAPLAARMFTAVLVEAAWEVLENSPVVIDRYRAVTIAWGYAGDSVLNSMADIGCMMIGFVLARKLPIWATITLALAFELLTSWAIRAWQAGA